MNYKKKIIQKLLEYDSLLHDREIDFIKRGYSDIPEANELLKSDPNAFLFAVIFDQGVPAERAWSAPYYLKKRLGHLDIDGIIDIGKDCVVEKCIKRPALHRYNYMGKWIWLAAKRLKNEYESNAENIWKRNLKARAIVNRLQEFKGIGQKKSNMATLLLYRDFGIEMRNLEGVDIAYDVHVRRVLLRTGLAKKDSVKHMVEVIRNFHPEFPAKIDGPLWHIGRNWCHARKAECGKCRLKKLCPKII